MAMEDSINSLPGEEAPHAPTARMLAWARNSSLYRLNRRMMTEHELSEALRRKAMTKFEGISEETARALAAHGVAFCHEHGFLDDRQYAEIKSQSGARSGRSRRRIARDLGIKGVARPLIEEALSEVDDLKSAIAFARKRAFGAFRKPDVEVDAKRRARELGAFARNGFSSSLASQVLAMTLEEIDDLEML